MTPQEGKDKGCNLEWSRGMCLMMLVPSCIYFLKFEFVVGVTTYDLMAILPFPKLG